MHLKSFHAVGFKRFTDLTVDGLAPNARLLVLAGPNGSGKSSFFDALKVWHWTHGSPTGSYDGAYHDKVGTPTNTQWPDKVSVEMHEGVSGIGSDELKKLLYVRSAHRNEADFQLNGLQRMASPLDAVRVQRTIDNDVSVSENYQRLVLQTLGSVYDDSLPPSETRESIRDRFIGPVGRALTAIFPDLTLNGLSTDPLAGGTFVFTKGTSANFVYKNLSAGEKACFDLLLDLVMSGRVYNNTVWCIDEPETHLNTRVQGALLNQLLLLLPEGCQLVLSSHSLGFLRRAWELAQVDPGEVQFLDFQDCDFDQQLHLEPTVPDRAFWMRTLDVALGDLAALVAPEQVVLCEGRPVTGRGRSTKSEFDARCYRAIFSSEFPNTDFVSLGNSDQVANDKLELGKSIQTLVSGTKVIRVVDRDLLTDQEVIEYQDAGVRVLTRRNIESFLLDDQVIEAFVTDIGQGEALADLLAKKQTLLAASVARRNSPDDLKSIAGEWYNYCRLSLGLVNSGSNWEAFAVKHLAPALKSPMAAYTELRNSIFG